MAPDQCDGNAVLHAFSAETRERLELVELELTPGQVIFGVGMPELYTYFPVTAVISLVSAMSNGATAEVAMVGREGIVGLAGLFGMSDSTTSAVTQIGGRAFRTTTAALRQVRTQNAAARHVLDSYTQTRLVQIAQVAACNRLHTIENRMARWLLDVHDRVIVEEFRLSHQSMADMLGVHRPTITIGLGRLQQLGAIEHQHRMIRVVDRSRLEAASCECRAILHREFVRSLALNPADPLSVATLLATGEEASPAATEALRDIAGRLLIANLQEQEARERAEHANRGKDHFLAMISHELRSPLQAILGWCDVLARQPQMASDGIPVIARNARMQLRLINDLMDSARISAGTLHVESGAASLAEIVESAAASIRPMADAKKINLTVDVPQALPALQADASRMHQVLVNVLTNAVKFTDRGGQIDARVTSTDRFQEVEVRDSGRGIAAEALPRAFERFQQGDSAGDHGLGLGLSIARSLVELHGGTISLDSPGVGRGAVCTVRLPAVQTVNLAAARLRGSP